jgi:uncharacterized protein YceK
MTTVRATAMLLVLIVIAVLSGCGSSSTTTNRSVPPGNQYRVGELCPQSDVGKTTTGADGKLVCQKVSGLDRWAAS